MTGLGQKRASALHKACPHVVEADIVILGQASQREAAKLHVKIEAMAQRDLKRPPGVQRFGLTQGPVDACLGCRDLPHNLPDGLTFVS
jgi:hypothetical protein